MCLSHLVYRIHICCYNDSISHLRCALTEWRIDCRHICNIDGDEDTIDETLAIGRADGEIVVSALRFIVKRRAGFVAAPVLASIRNASLSPRLSE